MHLIVKFQFKIIFFTPTTQHIFAHSPVSSFYINRFTIYFKMKHTVNQLGTVFTNTKCNILFIRSLTIHHISQFAGIKIRLSVTIRPPQSRILNYKLTELAIIQKKSPLFACLNYQIFGKFNVARLNDTFQHSFLLYICMIP